MSHAAALALFYLGVFTFILGSPTVAEPAGAAADTDHPPINTDRHGLAIEGYDPVAYFEAGGGEPIKGKKSITAEHGGATYRFANEDHRQRFASAPERYAPAFGGWCAYAMAEGKKVEVDPKRFEVHDGRLFLFYRDWFTDTLKPWQEQRDTLLPKADAAWEQVVEVDDE